MSKDETAALRAITAYARQHLSTGKVLDLHFDQARGAWVASAIGKRGAIEVVATPQGSGFKVSHAEHGLRRDAGAEVRSRSHVRNESAASFLMRGVVFAAVAAGLGLGYLVGKPHVEKMFQEAKEAGEIKPTGKQLDLGKELGAGVGGNSGMMERAEQLANDKKGSAAMNQFIKQNAGAASDKLDTLQQLNQTGQ